MAIDKTNTVGRFGCFKVLPLVFDEALSYYEVLCKLRNGLNDVIEQANSLVDELGLTDSEIDEIKTLVGEGSVDDRIYGAELAAKTYTDEQLAKTGSVLFDGTKEYGNTPASCESGDLRISNYSAVLVYDQYASSDGAVVCSVTPSSTTGKYLITGIGNTRIATTDSTTADQIRVYLEYTAGTNELTRSQCIRPDDHAVEPSGGYAYATIKKITGLF